MQSSSICFGLLAGGQSQRMGMDKATLHWRGQPLWQHQLCLAVEIGASEVLIAGKPESPYRSAARVVADEFPGRGPTGGLSALLGAMASDWLLAVAVDMPFLDAKTLNQLLNARQENRGVVPLIEERAEPLAAVYPRKLAALARTHAQADDRALQSFVRAAESAGLIHLFSWPAAEAGCFRSLNTLAEFAAAQAASANL